MDSTGKFYIDVLRRAGHTAWWVIKIVIPTSLIVSLLDFYGVIAAISVYTEPFFLLIGLPGKAAVVYLSSLMLPLYVPLALMGSLAFDLREVSILSLMCLLAHNLPVEAAVQRKCGLPLRQSLPLRIGFSLIGGFVLHLLIPPGVSQLHADITQTTAVPLTVIEALHHWLVGTGTLCIKLLLVITALMFLQDYLKRHGFLQLISRPLSPFMTLCGLKPESSFIWLIANIVGLTYGAGIMAQEVEQSDVDREELRRVNRHIALNHSLLEDTTIFALIGVSWYWLVVPRLLFALIAVWGTRWLQRIFNRPTRH